MKKIIIVFIIVFAATMLIPLTSLIPQRIEKSSPESELVTMFEEETTK